MTQMASRSPSGPCPWAPSSPSHLWTTPLLVAALACGGSGAGESAGSGDEPAVSEGRIAIPTSGLTPELLADSVLSRQPGAHEIPLHELGFQYGSPEAPISVVEFSDYGCGYCRRFQVETFPTLLTDFIEQGRVKWRYVTYLSGAFPKSLPAAMVAECAGEQRLFAPVSHLIYERQRLWRRDEDPTAAVTALATEAGADEGEIEACVSEQRPLARLRAGIAAGRRLGVRGTPYFLIEGAPTAGAQPLEWWIRILTAVEAEIESGAGDAS